MGILSGFATLRRKSEAAVVVQNLLELQIANGFFELDAARTANKLVGGVWESKPDVYDGKFGQRPHKLSVAASALVFGLDLFPEGDANRYAIVLSLGMVVREAVAKGRLYPLNSLDEVLLERALEVYAHLGEQELADPHNAELFKLLGL